ncbi:hypothetical protein TNCV_1269951 [Trichonephila clavipes]|nr:hypothetical protein TNCV_1269951 [Trichonephila clavipes]
MSDSLNLRYGSVHLRWARENIILTRKHSLSVLITGMSWLKERRIEVVCCDLCGEQENTYCQLSIIERHCVKGMGIIVGTGISMCSHTDVHLIYDGVTLFTVKYREEMLPVYVTLYADAIDDGFTLIDI